MEHSRDKYQELYDTIPVGYFTLDESHTILEANATAAKLIGTTRQALLGSKLSKFVVHDQKSQAAFYLHVKNVCKTGSYLECGLEMQREDGSHRHAHLSSLPILDKITKRTNILVAVKDGTEYHEAELKIRQSEKKKYRHLFETMSQGVIYQDTSGQVISANTAAQQILGMTLEQLQKRFSNNLHNRAIHEDGSVFNNDQHPSAIALKTGQAVLAVLNVVMGFFNALEGDYRWTRVCAMPQFEAGEALPFQTYITLNDITELKKNLDALKKSEAKANALIKYAPTGIFEFDFHISHITSVNDATCLISGYSREELLTMNPVDI